MFGLVLGALRRRWVQAVLLFVLAVVATTGAAAAPVYIVSSVQSLAATSVGEASTAERVVAAQGAGEVAGGADTALRSFRDTVVAAVDLPGFTTVSGVNVLATFATQVGQLTYREDFCAHVVLDGDCPSSPKEIALDQPAATDLGIRVGDEVAATLSPVGGSTQSDNSVSATFRLVGIYRAVDPLEDFWGRQKALDDRFGERLGKAYAFTPLSTFAASGRNDVTMTVDLVATPQAFRERDPQLLAQALDQGTGQLVQANIAVSSSLRTLANRIFDNQRLIYVGVAVGAGELLLICWFALFLAVSQTGQNRRGDVRLLKMRGARRRDIWRLLAGQSLIPLTVGGLVGFAAGGLLGQWQGAVAGADMRRLVLLAMVASTVLAIVGAVVAALVAERRMLGESVAALDRGVVAARRGWRAGVFDAVVLALAIGSAYQIATSSGGSDSLLGAIPGGPELLAPILLALAVGVLAARLIPVAAARLGGYALRAGRIGTGLAAMHLARRPDTSRVLGLVAVVVAILCGTVLSWSASDRARHDRAVYEVGADRVITVRAPSAAKLLEAVRQADPSGRYAMAAIQHAATTPVLAVDTSRLAAVAPPLPSYGLGEWQTVADALRPATGPPISIEPGELALDATWSSPSPQQATIVATLQDGDAAPLTVAFGPMNPGRHTYRSTGGCEQRCRLVSLGISTGPKGGLAEAGTVATVHSLTGVEAAALADRTRWRANVVLGEQVLRVATGPNGLTLTVVAETLASGRATDASAFVLDAPTPVPVVGTEGLNFADVTDPRLSLTDFTTLPVRVVATAHAVPRIGRGVLVDLEYADRLAGEHDIGTMQVWLAADAPAAVAQRILDSGLTVVSEESVANRADALSAQAPPVALRFLLLVALVGVALAMIMFAVMTAVERTPRRIELAALRRQGLRRNVVRQVAFGGYTVLVLAAVGVGSVTAAVLAAFVPAALPVFDDGWNVLALPAAAGYMLPLAAVAVAVALCALGVVAATSLAAATQRNLTENR